MRPDAEHRSTQSSPTATPPAPPVARVPPAPKGRGTGRKVLVGVGAVVLVAGSAVVGLAGGVVHGGASLPPLDESAASNTAREPAEAAADTEAAEERVEFGAMSVQVPEGWAAETVQDTFGPGPAAEEQEQGEWLVLYPEGQQACAEQDWSWRDTGTGCAHVKVLGSQGIQFGAGGLAFTLLNVGPYSGFAPDGAPAPCPEGVPAHAETDPAFRGAGEWVVTDGKAGEEPTGYAEGSVACVDPATGGQVYVDQRIWMVWDTEILFVDAYGLDPAESVVASAEW